MAQEEKRKGSVSDNPTGTGKRIGDYVLGETLGQGSFGKVKLATNARTKEKVAIKIVEKSTISDVEDVERVYRETFILTTLKHQNIVRLHEVIDTPTALCLAMDYADGGELYDYVNSKGRLDEIEACRLFHEIVAGVEYCHRMKIIHRDLKLENILMHEGSVKIADFGLSNTIKFGQKMNTNCGTPAYTCPEQIMGKKYIGSAADIWSLGIILYGMVCGFLPFEANGIPALFRKIKTRQFRHADYVTKECCSLIDRMLTIDPEKRATLSEIRSHAWYLQDYNPELIERIEAVGTISPETIALAHRDCMECSEDSNATDRTGYAAAQPASPTGPSGVATAKARGSMFPAGGNGTATIGTGTAKQKKGAPAAAKTATQRAREDRERALFEQQQFHAPPSLFATVNREDSGRGLGLDRPNTGPAKRGLSRPGSVSSSSDPEEAAEYSEDTDGSVDDAKNEDGGSGGNRSLFVDTEQEDDPDAEDELDAAASVRRRIKGRTISINTNVLAGNRAHSPKSGDYAKYGDRTPLSGGIGLPTVSPSPNNKGARSPLTPSGGLMGTGPRPSTSSHATKSVSPMGLSPLNAAGQTGMQPGAFFSGNTLQPLSPMAPFHQRKPSNGTPINLPSPSNAMNTASPKARKSLQQKGATPKSLDMSALNGSMSPKNSPASPTTPNAGRVRASVMLFEARAESNAPYSPNQRNSTSGARPPSGVGNSTLHGRDSPNPNKGYAVHLPPIAAAGSSRDLLNNGAANHGGFGKASGSPRYSLEADKDSRELGALNYGLGTLKREAGRGSMNSAFNNLIGALESTTGSSPLNSALGLPSALAPEHSMKVRVPRTPRASTLDGKERDSFVGYGDKDSGLSGGAIGTGHFGGSNPYIESRAPAVLRVSSEPAGSVT